MADHHTLNRCRLLAIPPELRLKVYAHCFSTFILDTSRDAFEKDGLQAPILDTCHLIRHEALPVYKTCIEDARDDFERKFEFCRKRARSFELSGEIIQTRDIARLYSSPSNSLLWNTDSVAFIDVCERELGKVEKARRE